MANNISFDNSVVKWPQLLNFQLKRLMVDISTQLLSQNIIDCGKNINKKK